MSEIQLINHQLFDTILNQALASPRKRRNHNFHQLTEVYQRFLNVLTKDTFIAVHRHLLDPKPETFVILQGKVGFLIFNEDGSIKEKHCLSSEGPVVGIDIQAGVWHNLICLSNYAICFEGKSGPYDPNIDKEFHPSYPNEGDPDQDIQLKQWKDLF
ncbi:cupin fold metalloprotein, WbuC family [Leptospira ryugenii]|uniref:Cupin fold metalloprotein, WbuC family n=1 Tax=Leptospira ryugenii TaxID=1917863 RepID=A0A2P2E3C9_9LEPT|nr:WbuC family cupin fold metalloprotein [Leptospira ryugenii]GBF51359.1 cupin fold metalloprotein, WbuC family [Leptospira ryugenii]